MSRPPCEQLDDFLSRALSDPERAAFAAHLEGCAPCRQRVQEQERHDELLRQAVTRLEPVPEGLVERTRRRIGRGVRRRLLGGAAGLAAAVALAVTGVW